MHYRTEAGGLVRTCLRDLIIPCLPLGFHLSLSLIFSFPFPGSPSPFILPNLPTCLLLFLLFLALAQSFSSPVPIFQRFFISIYLEKCCGSDSVLVHDGRRGFRLSSCIIFISKSGPGRPCLSAAGIHLC